MTFHIRDIAHLTNGEYVIYLNEQKVEDTEAILLNSFKVDSISVENGVIRFDISQMRFTVPDSNDEFAKEYKKKAGEDVSFF